MFVWNQDDNEELLSFLVDELSDTYRVSTVVNGQLALDYLKPNNEVDLIISDIMMPSLTPAQPML